MFQETITPEEIELLDLAAFPGQIHVISQPGPDLDHAVEHLSSQRLIGFDTETKPVFQAHQPRHHTALLQLSSETEAFLFRLHELGLPQDVADIMNGLHDNMAKIVEHGERAISIIQGILLVSRGKEDEFLPSDVNRIVHEYVWLSYHAMRAKDKTFNITIHENLQDGLPLMMVIPQDLSRAVLNLVNNACYAVHQRTLNEGDDYHPTIDVTTAMDGDQLTITIADNGEGMSDDVKARLFENFFTTKPIGKGTGLGMSITRDIIEQKHHGRLTFESTLNQGTTFTITIPVRKS